MQPFKGISQKPGEEATEPAVAGRKQKQNNGERPVSLKILADYLGLCPATVSVVLNNVPGRSIPAETRERVQAAARKFNYQPSLLARSLRKQRTFTVGVLAPELSDGYHTMVMSGIGDHLMREGYFYFTAHHRHKPDMIEEYPRLLLGRGAEGLIAIDTALAHALPVPVVAVAGHRKIPGVTNVVLDHKPYGRGIQNLMGMFDALRIHPGSTEMYAGLIGLITIVTLILWNEFRPEFLRSFWSAGPIFQLPNVNSPRPMRGSALPKPLSFRS